MKDDDILQLALDLRPELPALLNDESARSRLEQCIADAERGAITPGDLFQELAGEPSVRRWIKLRLDSDGANLRGFGMTQYQPLAGLGGAVSADEFVCPETGCPSRWFRQRVGQKPPLCEKHHKPLVLKPK